jgi:XTP/dITP diphosphohydrolase
LKTIGNEGLFKIASALGNFSAEAKTVIGYAKSSGYIHFLTGVIKGKIAYPRGNNGFGWDPIFEVENLGKTFAELTIEDKNEISMRRKAFQEFKNFLEKAT